MNANTYARITRDDFETFLADEFGDFEAVSVPHVRELVYDLPVAESDDLTVRVFSSLDAREGDASRDAGNDAIKCVVWSDSRDRPVASSGRTNRITTWRKNLAPKIADLFEQAREMAAEQNDETDAAVAAVESLPVASGADGEVVVSDLSRDEFGRARAHLTGDTFDAKDAIKFDWEQTHHKFDRDSKAWLVDVDGLDALAAELESFGFSLVQADLTGDVVDDDAFDVESCGVGMFDRVTVAYTAKRTHSEKTVEGDVVARSPERITIRRDDGHTMFVTDDGLFTTGSHYPFVGTVEGIETDAN